MDNSQLSLTTEALICLAVNYEMRPQPLLLMQLGLDSNSTNSRVEFLRVLDRGGRALLSIHDSAEPSDEMKLHLRKHVELMCKADVFASLRRSDNLGSSVFYCSDDSVMDEIGEDGNHKLRLARELPLEVESFLGDHKRKHSGSVVAPLERFEPGATSNEDEPTIIRDLASDESIVYLASIGRPENGELTMFRWRGIDERLFEFEVDNEQVTLTPTTTDDATAKVVSEVLSMNS